MNKCLLMILLSLSVPSIAAAPADDAEAIVRESDRRQRVQSETYDGQLEVVDPAGKIFKKTWRLWREGNGSQNRVLLRFTSPPEVDGVGLLILGRANAPDDQWMYTPAIRRDRRIAPQDRAARFMGTDFSYEDMEQRDIDEYRYEMLGEVLLAGQACWKIRAKPKLPEQSQYSWSELWVRKDNYVVVNMELYVKDQKRKTLEMSDLEQIQGVWTARQMRMKDLERGGSTTLRRQNIKYNVTLDKDFFSLRTLRTQ